MNAVTNLNTDDYLDLYLFARKIGDKIWQNEIIVKMRDFLNGHSEEIQSFDLDVLWEKYKSVNNEIVALYRKLLIHSTNEELQGKIMNLKQLRLSIGRQMDSVKDISFYN